MTRLKKLVAILERMLINIDAETGSIPNTFRECHKLSTGTKLEANKCFADMIIKYAPLDKYNVLYEQYYQGKDFHYMSNYRLYLPDGSVITTFLITEDYVIFGVDVNGDKGPNKGGIDIYQMHYYPYVNTQKFKPLIAGLNIRGVAPGTSGRAYSLNLCKTIDHPQECFRLILSNNYKPPKDYPKKF